MKLYKNAIILAVVLVLVAGGYFGYREFFWTPPVDDPDSPNLNMIPLVSLTEDYNELDTITVVNQGETLVFAKVAEDEWGVIIPENVKVDKYKSKAAFINACPFNASKIISEDEKELTKYGLDKPSATITIKAKDGSQATILIGNKTSTGENHYGMLEGSEKNTVYTISNYVSSKYLYRLEDIKDKAIFYGTVSDDVLSIQLSRKGSIVFAADQKADKSFNITAPISGSADLAKISPMIETIVKLQVSEYITLNAVDLDQYGFNKPQYAIKIKTPNIERNLLIGNEKEREVSAYAHFEGSSEVFVLKLSDLNFVDRPLKEMVEVFAYIVNIDDVVRFELSFDGHYDNFTLEHNVEDKQNSKFYMNGKDASMKDESGNQIFRQVYREAIGLIMDDMDINATPAGTPEMTITYHKSNGEVMKIDYISKDDFHYYVMKNGIYSGILVRKKELDEPEGLRNRYDALVEAVNAAAAS